MLKLHLSLTLLVAAAALCAGSALAANSATRDLEVKLNAYQIRADAAGKETRAPGQQAQPGDVIEYRADYRNSSKAAIRNLDATLPVPAGLEYQGESARPSKLEASVDGNSFAPVPLTRIKKNAQGKSVSEPVPYAEYRYLRWKVGTLPPGETASVSARMKVRRSAEPAPPLPRDPN
jgi:uncharacterized repeat protein (TIGR01451 family)